MKDVRQIDTQKLVLLALLTAIIAMLQSLAALFPLYPFTLTLVLVPMVIGSALISPWAGAWLGAVFGFVVLITGNANLFLALDPAATISVVILKGALAGLAAGAVYKLLAKKSKTIAVIAAAIVCPIVNTGIFIIGSYMFFLPVVMDFAEHFGHDNATAIIFLGFIGINFPLELGINLVLSPAVVRLVQIGQDRRAQS